MKRHQVQDCFMTGLCWRHVQKVSAKIVVDERVSDDAVWFPAAVSGAEKLSRLFGEVTLDKG